MRAHLQAISDALGRWDEATGSPVYRLVGVAAGLALFLLLLGLPAPEGLSVPAWRTAAVGALMATWWLGRVLPLAVTALIPVLALPVLGILPLADAAMAYADPLNLLMFGGFVLGYAMERAGLHTRLVAALLRPAWVRGAPDRVLLALMLATGLLSSILSNTATMLMLLPVAVDLGRRCTDQGRERSAFVLGLAYAASLGGLGTLVGTPPNAILANVHPEVTFARWSALGVPALLVGIPVAWWVVARLAILLPRRFESPPPAPHPGPWTGQQVAVLTVLGAALIAWMFRVDIDMGAGWGVPGWGDLLPPGASHDAWVAVGAAGLVFLIPAANPESGEDGRMLVSASGLERSVPWSVLLLLGGGFSLAEAVERTQLTQYLGQGTAWLARVQGYWGEGSWWGLALAVLLVCLALTFATEMTSNTATAQILLPVLAAGAVTAGLDPLYWTIPATLSVSCAFMMPVATAPNAIAAAAGVSPADMAFAGLILNFVFAVFLSILVLALVPLVFP
jgi:sodium-dependent dicarboxylate transporter 2/3/5